jgi:predicted nucleotidyltransferase
MYPGTDQHRVLLEAVVKHYQHDDRVLAVCVFGSLARGNWDEYSDLDLDVVIQDGVQIDVIEELQALCAALGEGALIIVPSGADSGDVVLKSLSELSIRYHSLATTSPNIVDSIMLLTGKIDIATIKAAGLANRTAPPSVSTHDVDRLLRWALEVTICLRREKFWQGVRLLQYMRDMLIDIFAYSRGYVRSSHAFDSDAGEKLQAQLAQTFPRNELSSLKECLFVILDLLENYLAELSSGQLQLTTTQRELIVTIRARLA